MPELARPRLELQSILLCPWRCEPARSNTTGQYSACPKPSRNTERTSKAEQDARARCNAKIIAVTGWTTTALINSLDPVLENNSPDNIFKDCIVEKIFSKFKIVKPQYSFTIKKNIPVKSGLGSASSNAAAVLRILKKLDYKEVKTINFSAIGADVPLFVENHDSLIRGIGDITIKQSFPKYYFLLIKPIQNCSTEEMYNEAFYFEQLVDYIQEGNKLPLDKREMEKALGI